MATPFEELCRQEAATLQQEEQARQLDAGQRATTEAANAVQNERLLRTAGATLQLMQQEKAFVLGRLEGGSVPPEMAIQYVTGYSRNMSGGSARTSTVLGWDLMRIPFNMSVSGDGEDTAQYTVTDVGLALSKGGGIFYTEPAHRSYRRWLTQYPLYTGGRVDFRGSETSAFNSHGNNIVFTVDTVRRGLARLISRYSPRA